MKYIYAVLTAGVFSISNASALDHSHKNFSELLSAHVKMSADKTSSTVDYKNFNKKKLETYLSILSKVSKTDFDKFNHKEQLAFLINSYNGFTLKIVLDNSPLKSIKDIGMWPFSTAWKKDFFTLLGQKRTLDELEHKMIRGDKNLNKDPRIHFALNCASIGCPALLDTAWTAESMEQQFDSAAKGFLKDRSRNLTNAKKGRVELNNIFKWYGTDFNSAKYGSLKKFLAQYVDSITDNKKERTLVLSGSFDISYTGYDWSLNQAK